MTSAENCKQNRDPLKIAREGTSQEERYFSTLDPSYVLVDERTVAHDMVFAREYASFLTYFNSENISAGDWKPFFSEDVLVQLAVAAVQDVEHYRKTVREYLRFLSNYDNAADKAALRNHLDYLFSCCATMTICLDRLKEELPTEIALKGLLVNLVREYLAPAIKCLIACYKGGAAIADAEKPVNDDAVQKAAMDITGGNAAPLRIFGSDALKFSGLAAAGLSRDWMNNGEWQEYYAGIAADRTVYGNGDTVFERVNHLSTHNLFGTALDQYLKAYSRIVGEAKDALNQLLLTWNRHEPHYALLLAFLRLLDLARAEVNTFTRQHLDMYYRQILRFKEKTAVPGRAHLLVELAKQAPAREFKAGEKFKAGKDDLGIDAFYQNDRVFVANKAHVADLKTVFVDPAGGRLYASPKADSEDGLGAKLSADDQSWHPFYNKKRKPDGTDEIMMPRAKIGFAIASHYLRMAGGSRKIKIESKSGSVGAGGSAKTSRFRAKTLGAAAYGKYVKAAKTLPGMVGEYVATSALTASHETLGSLIGGAGAPSVPAPGVPGWAQNREQPALQTDYRNEIMCLFTGEKGWIEKKPDSVFRKDDGTFSLEVRLSGDDPAVCQYSPKKHGYAFTTDLPLLMIMLRNQDNTDIYGEFRNIFTEQIDLSVDVSGLKNLAISTDFGPVDTSKPFQPFGAIPANGASLVIGSKEAFQKNLTSATVHIAWQNAPEYYTSKTAGVVTVIPKITVSSLAEGEWILWEQEYDVSSSAYDVTTEAQNTSVDAADHSADEQYHASSRNGYVRLVLKNDLKQKQYQIDLANYLAKVEPKPSMHPGMPISGPFVCGIVLDYTAKQTLLLGEYETRKEHFFHIAPFGHAEQHPIFYAAGQVPLLPQFSFFRDGKERTSEAEFYLGVADVDPPQNVSLLFQLVDGTANPLSVKPERHIHWSFLSGNTWKSFAESDVDDRTGGLLNSGIVTFSIPADASVDNTLMPAGVRWIRAAVESKSDTVCRLSLVAAQALDASFADSGNDPAFPAKVLPAGTISKLDQPDSLIKKIQQPFPSFGGRGREAANSFYTRVSERLRHKDRAITLWDCERLVLEAFPEIYKVKCLNHTQYEPSENGGGVYRELASGHITIVTIPDLRHHRRGDPLRPYTSLGLLERIHAFLTRRLSGFITLHTANPQFEDVLVDFKVRLHGGYDEKFMLNKLNESVTRYLSPWAFAGSGNPNFGGKVVKSMLISFVESLPYVDYVLDFNLYHVFQDDNGMLQKVEKNEVEGSRAVSILVSARDHVITAVKPAAAEVQGEKCRCEA